MKNTLKTLIASCAIFALTASAQAAPTVEVDAMDAYYTNLEPGYHQMIDNAPVYELDAAIAMVPEFEQPNNFMSDVGVYRYAYFEKTGIWLSMEDAHKALQLDQDMDFEWTVQ